MVTPDELWALLPGVPEKEWLRDAEARVRAEPESLGALFARAGRKLGRQEVPGHPGWTPGMAGRAILIAIFPEKSAEIYAHGDTAERLAVLHALHLLAAAALPPGPAAPAGSVTPPETAAPAGATAPGGDVVGMLEDALRANDPRLVATALSGPAADRLGDDAWRQGVVKCVFMGIALARVHRLAERADDTLVAMLVALREERTAAGRRMPADAVELIEKRR